jgi:hypothetical protein
MAINDTNELRAQFSVRLRNLPDAIPLQVIYKKYTKDIQIGSCNFYSAKTSD